MLQLIKIFWDICRLRTGPQQLPKGYLLLGSALLAGIIIDSIASSVLMPKLTGPEVLITVTIYNLFLLSVIFFLLMLVGYAERGIQTVTAVAGSGLFISLVLLPGLLMVNSVEEQAKSFVLFILIDNFWRLAVNAHIFRHALSVGMLMAMILSVSYFLFGILVADFLLAVESY